MGKTDVVVRSAADLERKYNFASLLGLKKNVEITAQGIQKIENELNSMLNALVINLKDVLDSQGEISLWFYSTFPTTSNEPYISWENPNDHIGDIYYDQSSGYVYQWNGVWEVNTSPDLIEAMAITNAETDTSTDHERKVFFETPTVPDSNGDWWVKEDGSLFICQISKESGTYEEIDYIDSSSYTESIAEKIGEEIQVLKGTIAIISENYAKFTDLATGGSTVISGDNITTGNIQSQNYIQDTSGTKIALEDGTIDTKNFKVDAEGNIEATSGLIGGFNLGANEFVASVSTTYNFTQSDYEKVQAYIMGETTLTEEELLKYDVNGDGQVNSADYVLIQQMIEGTSSNTITGTFTLDTKQSLRSLILKDSNGKIKTSVGLNGMLSQNINAEKYLWVGDDILMYGNSGDITCKTLTQTSLESKKKNFEKLENALDIVNKTDIYSYNFKDEEDNHKKHIGVVIGDDYNYANDIATVNEDGEATGIDSYSMVSVLWKAVQELQEEIKTLKEG